MAEVKKGNWCSFIEQVDTHADLNPLAVLFRKLCDEMKITSNLQYEELLQAYAEKHIPDVTKRNAAKGNIRSAMVNPNMTISVFTECLRVLDVDIADFTLICSKGDKVYTAKDSRIFNQKRRRVTKPKIRRRRTTPN